jgi:transposase
MSNTYRTLPDFSKRFLAQTELIKQVRRVEFDLRERKEQEAGQTWILKVLHNLLLPK